MSTKAFSTQERGRGSTGCFEQSSSMYSGLLKTSRFRETLRRNGNGQRGAVERMPSTTNRGSYKYREWVKTTRSEYLPAWDSHTFNHSKPSHQCTKDYGGPPLDGPSRQALCHRLLVCYLRGVILSLPAQVLSGPLPPGGVSPILSLAIGTCTTPLSGGIRGKRPILWTVCCRVTSHEAAEVKVSSCDLGNTGKVWASQVSLFLTISVPHLLSSKEKEGSSDAWSWSVQLNGQKPDLSHGVKSSQCWWQS